MLAGAAHAQVDIPGRVTDAVLSTNNIAIIVLSCVCVASLAANYIQWRRANWVQDNGTEKSSAAISDLADAMDQTSKMIEVLTQTQNAGFTGMKEAMNGHFGNVQVLFASTQQSYTVTFEAMKELIVPALRSVEDRTPPARPPKARS